MAELNIAFIGNPNCGKTTLFNAYTGANLKVANWPGVTVEKIEGRMKYHGHTFNLVDLPGLYSLTSYTMEETLARDYILSDSVDVIIDVADASSLERNLYLTLQLIELGKPVVLALNMMDIVEERGMEIDMHRLPEMLGIPVIPVSARKRTGLDILMHAAEHHAGRPHDITEHHHHEMPRFEFSDDEKTDVNVKLSSKHHRYVTVYSDAIEEKIDLIVAMLKQKYPDLKNLRWYAIKILENDENILKQYPLDLSGILKTDFEPQIINEKYDFIQEIIDETLVNKDEKSAFTDKIDKALTHRIWGVPIFLAIMAVVFFLTFTIGDFLKGFFENWLEAFSMAVRNMLTSINTNGMLVSLIVDGIITGVGSVLTFLPNIFILFLALAFLEDSGYMSRVAYVMDGIMGKLGLSGRAFIPMLLGFGCTVPAIMASRSLENRHDKLRTILITPFMSCSARLPIYVMFSKIFFGKFAVFYAYSMYLVGFLIALLIAFIVSKVDKKNNTADLLIELPEYKTPNARTIMIYVWEKVRDYLGKAGTTIFLASIVIWFILNFGFSGQVTDMSQSFAASLGIWLVPVMKPTGLGYWQIVVSLISGVAAKEVVVSSMAVLYGISNISSPYGMAALGGVLENSGFTAVNAYAMMLFCLLYIPCVATIATIRRETNIRHTLIAIFMQLGLAWIVSALFYQIGSAVL
ncbi:MAG: ferrous iron transport protein B [Clostridia bacterium]|nr:ferrous iron transport protein B [Clostridia bacterium]